MKDYVNTSKVTRFEIIDHTPCDECEGFGWVSVPSGKKNEPVQRECIACHGSATRGRTVIAKSKDLQFDVELQDNDRTLKVFIHERYE